jgi:hypothetical protein
MNDTQASGSSEVSFTAPTKPAVVVGVVVLGAVLGAGPVALAFHRAWLVGPVALVGFGVAVRSATTLPRQSFHEPGAFEFVLTGIRVAALCAAASLSWLALYYAIYWTLGLINPSLDRDPYAFWISFWFGLISMGGLTWVALRNLPSELYPTRPETPRRFEVMLKYQRRELLTRLGAGAVILVAVGAYAFGFQRNGLALYIVLIILLMLFAGLLIPSDSDSPAGDQELGRTLEAALERSGFRCSHDVVPNVDLLARKENGSLAIEVMASSGGEPVGWVAGAGIASAARRLSNAEEGEATPMLVLVDVEPARSLQAFCESENVVLAVVPVAPDASVQVRGSDDPALTGAVRAFQELLRTRKGRLTSVLAAADRRRSSSGSAVP